LSLQYRSAADLAAEDIRRRIHSGELEPDTKISIDDLAAEMRVSSTPVREALKELQSEGLVRIAPRSGVYVRRISADEVAEVYAVKQSLEPLMVRWAMLRGRPDRLRAVVVSVRDLAVYARDERLGEYVALVEERRSALLEMADSEVLTTIFQTIDGRVRLLRYRNLAQPGRMARSSLEHKEVADAIGAGDVDRACVLQADHVRSATRSLLSLMGEDAEGISAAGRRRTWSLEAEFMTTAAQCESAR